jgi:hypothetical protein
MSRVQVKQKKKHLDNYKELSVIFEQMTGIHDQAEPHIVVPKIVEVYNEIVKYIRVLQLFIKTEIIQQTKIYKVADIEKFIQMAVDELAIDLSIKEYTECHLFPNIIDFYKAQIENNAAKIESYQKGIFTKYNKIKESETLKSIIETCGNLKPYAQSLFSVNNVAQEKISEHSRYHSKYQKDKKETKPDWDFIINLHRLCPFSYAPLIDIKFLWIQQYMDKTRRKLLLSTIFKIYLYGSSIFDITTSPDIDTSKLSELFIAAISSAKSQLTGFDAAFKIIEGASDLLNRKFNDYYRDSLRNNKNSMVFFEDFFADLASENTDAASKVQLKQLAVKLKEMISQLPEFKNDKTVQTLIQLMDRAVTQV